jgi:hypothetical protein
LSVWQYGEILDFFRGKLLNKFHNVNVNILLLQFTHNIRITHSVT